MEMLFLIALVPFLLAMGKGVAVQPIDPAFAYAEINY